MVGWDWGLGSARSPSGAPLAERTQDTIREDSIFFAAPPAQSVRLQAAILQVPSSYLQKLPETQ